MTHVRSQPFGGIIFSDAGDAIARQVFGPRRFRPPDPQAGGGITITPDGLNYTISAPGGATVDDAQSILSKLAYAPHERRLPTVRAADASITVTEDALGYLIAATASGAVDDQNNVIAQLVYGLHGYTVTELTLLLSDNAIDDVSTDRHGFAPKAPNDSTKFLNGLGTYSVPAGTGAATDFLIVQVFS